MFAASDGQMDLLSELAKKGVDVNSVDFSKRTALHVASSTGKLEVVKLLISMDADVNAVDSDLMTPLEDAMEGKHDNVISYLYENGGRLSSKRKGFHADIMLVAATAGDLDTLQRGIRCGLDPNTGDYDLRCPMHLASAEGHVSAVQVLLDHGATVNPVDRFGNTPLSDSQRNIGEKYRKTSELLLSKGATLTPSGGLNTAKLSVTISDSLSTLVTKSGFQFVEAWVPSPLVLSEQTPKEFVAQEYWFADPKYLEKIKPFASNSRGKTLSSKNVSKAFLQCWNSQKPVIVTDNVQSCLPGRQEIASHMNFTNIIMVPLLNKIQGKKHIVGVLQFYTLTAGKVDPAMVEEFTLFTSRMVQAGYGEPGYVPTFNEYPGLNDPQLPVKIFEEICNNSTYSAAAVYYEVDKFFSLGFNASYFNSFDTKTVARHITSLIGAKKFAETTMDEHSIWLEVQNNQDFMGGAGGHVTSGPEQAIMMISLTKGRQLAAERRLQDMIDRLPLDYSFNINYVESEAANDPDTLGLYVLRSEEYAVPPSEVSMDDTSLHTIAGKGFQARNRDEIAKRYQDILDAAAKTLAPVYQILPEQADGTIPCMLAFRQTGRSGTMNSLTEMMHQMGLRCPRKYAQRFSTGFLVFHLNFAKGSDMKAITELMDQMMVMEIIPQSQLTPSFLRGDLAAENYIYASCAGRFVLYFVNQRSEEFDALVKQFKDKPTSLSRLKNLHTNLKREAVSMTRVWEVIEENPLIVAKLSEDFRQRTETSWPTTTPPPPNEALVAMIKSKTKSVLDAQVLTGMHAFNQSVLKTNIDRREKSSLAFRLNCDFLDPEEWPTVPYGIFFVLNKNFQGFHIRFRDVARGGIRLIVSRDRPSYTRNLGTLFTENYGLAHTQNNKNKDIPEFGSKGTVLLAHHADPATEGFTAFQAYISGLMDLVVPDETMVDNYKKEELLFLGPDEGTANMMEWAAKYADTRGYGYWKALTTGKPPIMGGIPHDTYGMTTRSVHRYVVGSLRKMGLDESKVTKVQTGGPDGDLGSNEILISKDITKCIVDGAGVVFDPNGLDRGELTRLATERSMIDGFDATKLGEGGFKVLVDETNVTLPTGELVESGLTLRNDFHFHPLFEADLFVPCGGRPESVNMSNVHRYIKEDGTPRFRIIVEGANLFLTNDARQILEEAGVVLFKDASSNKGGVTSSSLEVLAALSFSDEEFKAHMSVEDVNNPPAFYARYCEEIQTLVEHFADLEFECVWREHELGGRHRYLLTEAVSEKINELTDFVAESDTLWENEDLRRKVLTEAIPTTLLDQLGLDEILKNVPESYLRAIFSTYLASRYVYKHGLNANEFAFFEFMRPFFQTEK